MHMVTTFDIVCFVLSILGLALAIYWIIDCIVKKQLKNYIVILLILVVLTMTSGILIVLKTKQGSCVEQVSISGTIIGASNGEKILINNKKDGKVYSVPCEEVTIKNNQVTVTRYHFKGTIVDYYVYISGSKIVSGTAIQDTSIYKRYNKEN